MNLILLNIIIGMFLIIVVALSWWAFWHYFKKIKEIRSSNKKGVKKYTENIVIGIVGGTIVLVLDKIVVLLFSKPPTLDFTSALGFLFSLLNGLFVVFLSVGVLLFCVAFIMYHGIKHLKNKKK